MHPNDTLLLAKYATEYFRPGSKVLEVGPNVPSQIEPIMGGPSVTWETVDIFEDAYITHLAVDEYTFPVADDTFDVVVAANVLEHVRRIWVWTKELVRVAKPGGYVITVNPVSWPFHEFPIDCWRAYPDGMRALYEEAGLEVVLSTCESLEAPDRPRRIPGRSQEYIEDPTHMGWKYRYANKLLVRLGYPVERAFDTISIGRKSSAP